MDPHMEQELKQYFFKEYTALHTLREDNKALYEKLMQERRAFESDRKLFNTKILDEKKRIKDENALFEKRLGILQNGFLQLDMDRKKLEKEREDFENGRSSTRRIGKGDSLYISDLFSGAVNKTSLKKRYRDLLKIFHPDNCGGDDSIVKAINDEYERIKN